MECGRISSSDPEHNNEYIQVPQATTKEAGNVCATKEAGNVCDTKEAAVVCATKEGDVCATKEAGDVCATKEHRHSRRSVFHKAYL